MDSEPKQGLECYLHEPLMPSRTRHWGNPAEYATWQDESLNGILARVGQTAHSRVWHQRCYLFFSAAEADRMMRMKRQRRSL
eukprot:8181628-Alexandrium_andersonii.AAC.1